MIFIFPNWVEANERLQHVLRCRVDTSAVAWIGKGLLQETEANGVAAGGELPEGIPFGVGTHRGKEDSGLVVVKLGLPPFSDPVPAEDAKETRAARKGPSGRGSRGHKSR